jgi:hypothetical protein
LFNHVLPYYRPPAYELQASPLSEVEFDPRGIIAVHDAEIMEVRPGMLQVQGTGPDPWLVLDPGICKLLSNNTIVRAVLETSTAGVFRIYVDPGDGFSDRFSFGAPYPAGNSEILIPVSAPDCQGLRLDPATAPGAVRIRKLSFTRLRIRPPG